MFDTHRNKIFLKRNTILKLQSFNRKTVININSNQNNLNVMKPGKLAVLFLFITQPLFLSAQSKGNPSGNKFSFGVSFSPDYTYRHLSMKNDEFNFVDARNELDDPRVGFTTGLVAKYNFKERFALESGVQFSDRGDKMEMGGNEWITPDEILSIDSDPDPSIPDKFKSSYHYYYLGVPVKLNYYFLNGKIKMYASAGVAADFFVDGKNRTVMEFKDRTEKETHNLDENFNKVNFVGLAGLGVETDIFQLLTLRLEPVFRYSFTSVVDAPMKGYYYSAGVNIVLFCNL